jgi:tetratricopeptide (TPR) repeat protein
MQQIFEHNQTTLEQAISLLNVRGVGVAAESADLELNDELVLGVLGMTDIPVAIVLGSAGAKYHGKDIRTVLIAPTPQGSLFVDGKGNLAAKYFYFLDGGGLIPYLSEVPVYLDALIASFGGYWDSFPGPQDILINPPALYSYTDDKLAVKKDILEMCSRVKTPDYHIVDESSVEESVRIAASSLGNPFFVVKGNHGSHGDKVRIIDDVEQAIIFAAEELSGGDSVYIEKRIRPRDWNYEGRPQDWNIRALVTFSQDPVWVDAEVRHQDASVGGPVNISKTAMASELESVARDVGLDLEDLMESILDATRSLHQAYSERYGNAAGLIGFDIIIAEDGYYVIEINSGNVGGFGTLTRLRQAPLESIRQKMIPAYGQFMTYNRERRVPDGKFEGLPLGELENITLISILLRNKLYEEALEMVLRLDSELIKYSLLGSIYIQQEMYAEAIGPLSKVSEFADASSDIYVALATALSKTGRTEEAGQTIEKALALFKEDSIAYVNIGSYFFDEGKYEKAIDIANEGFTADAGVNSIHMLNALKARCYYRLGKVDDAKTSLEESLRYEQRPLTDVSYSRALTLLGQILVEREDYDKAYDLLKKSFEYDAGYWQTFYQLGVLFGRTGSYENSLLAFTASLEGIEEEKMIGDIHRNIGMACKALGDGDQAREHFRTALEHNPRDKIAAAEYFSTFMGDVGAISL